MCRYDPVTKTERRCPSYLDRASYNAKRRARYKEKRNRNTINNNVNAIDTFKSKGSIINEKFNHYKDLVNSKNLYGISDKVETIPNLNVDVRKCSGYLVTNQYFTKQLYSGQIDYNALDENSYKTFFSKPKQDGYSGFILNDSKVSFDETSYVELSACEMKGLDDNEKNSLNFFTTSHYQWFNDMVYTGDIERIEDIESTKNGSFSLFSQLKFEGDDMYTKANNIANGLDSAISKGPKVQKKLYRGVSSGSDFFKDTSPEEFIKNLNLGAELKFDSYQSSSGSYNTANNFADGDGIVFEMITPEGIQVSSNSLWMEEFETILPRNSRYVVVGIHKTENIPAVNVVQMVAINNKGEILDGTNSDPIEPLDFRRFKK